MGLFDRKPPYRSSSPLRVGESKNRLKKTLTASGERVTRSTTEQMQRLSQPWQRRALTYYDTVPEIKYGAQFYSRSLASLELYAAEMNDKGELEPTENPEAVDEFERIQDPGGGRTALLGTYGRLQFLTGESLLLVTRDKETGEEQWEMLSSDELRLTPSGYARFKAPSLEPEQLKEAPDDAFEPLDDETAVAYRLWRRHPRYSALADSTMMGSLDVCEELVLLTQAVRARARSRLAGSGILLINGKVIPLPPEAGPDEDPERDPFMEDLVEAMTSPIADEGSASAVVPHVIRVDVDQGRNLDEIMKHIQIFDPTQLYPETGLRREAIERLAIGLDMPPEILLGLADSNHWSAWQIDEQVWKAHLQPVAQQLVDDLNSSYYRPTLRQGGVQGWERFYIAYDATQIINHPDRGKDANEAYDRRAIGKRAYREAKGFDEDDAMTQQELDEAIGVATHDGSMAKYGIPTVKSGGIEPAPGEIQQGDGTGGGSNEVTKAPPPAPEDPVDGGVVGSANGHSQRSDRLLGAADLTLQRARELAGARLRSLARRDPELSRLIDGVPNAHVGATLGRESAEKLGAPPERQLVAGARDLLAQTLHVWRVDRAFAEPIGERVEQHAAKTLYDEHPAALPPAFADFIAELEAVPA